MLAASGLCDRAVSSESLELFALPLEDKRALAARSRLQRYCAIVSDDPAVRAVSGPEVLVFDPTPQRTDLRLSLQIGAQLGLDVRLEDARLGQGGAIDGPVALAPGSGSRAKCWPRESWIEFARRLHRAGKSMLIVIGPVEAERDDPRDWAWPCPVRILENVSCVELARALGSCSAFVGNDSGPSHLAAMLGLPTIALFGAGLPAVFAPLGPRAVVLQGSAQAPPDVAVDVVLRELATLLRG